MNVDADSHCGDCENPVVVQEQPLFKLFYIQPLEFYYLKIVSYCEVDFEGSLPIYSQNLSHNKPWHSVNA